MHGGKDWIHFNRKPIENINKISKGKRGKVTSSLQNLYLDLISLECEND